MGKTTAPPEADLTLQTTTETVGQDAETTSPNTEYVLRLHSEYSELAERIARLEAFLATDTYAALPREQQGALLLQRDHMQRYANVLAWRIDPAADLPYSPEDIDTCGTVYPNFDPSKHVVGLGTEWLTPERERHNERVLAARLAAELLGGTGQYGFFTKTAQEVLNFIRTPEAE